jgi:hypothetical protein
MMASVVRSPQLIGPFVRAFVPLSLMILARSWGEWPAYLTGRPAAIVGNAV